VPGPQVIAYSSNDPDEVTVARLIQEITGSQISFDIVRGLENPLMDNTRLKEQFGFVPQTTMREGLQSTYEWWRESSSPIVSELNPGGIDFNPNNINLSEQGDKMQIKFSTTGLQNLNLESINGILPVIINISPLPSILPLLGLAPKEEDFELSSLN